MLLEEELLGILLHDGRLVAKSEEAVWEAVVGWKGGTAGNVGWRGVVGKIRFPLIGEEYLRNRVAGMVNVLPHLTPSPTRSTTAFHLKLQHRTLP